MVIRGYWISRFDSNNHSTLHRVQDSKKITFAVKKATNPNIWLAQTRRVCISV